MRMVLHIYRRYIVEVTNFNRTITLTINSLLQLEVLKIYMGYIQMLIAH